MTTTKEKSARLENLNKTAEPLIQKFYEIRKAFKADYSGKLRSYKYEEARNFTIALNHAIFQANQLDIHDANLDKSIDKLSIKLEIIKQQYQALTR